MEKSGDKVKKMFRFLKEVLNVLIPAFIIALILNNVIIANAIVPTSSMENTIMTGDYVIGSRLSYYVSVSYTHLGYYTRLPLMPLICLSYI